MQKSLSNIKNPDENKEIVAEIKMNEKEKIKVNKNADQTLNIIEEILDYNKRIRENFSLASKVDKKKSESKP